MAKLSLCLIRHHDMKPYPQLNYAPYHEGILRKLR